MCYSINDEDYQKQYNLFLKAAPIHVANYFNKNWHTIRNEWVMGNKCHSGNFLNSTNNRVESFNGKLKSVIDHHSSLEMFLEGLLSIIYVLRNERDHKVVLSVQKRKFHNYELNSAECEYLKHLTPYAGEYAVKQLGVIGKYKRV